MLLETVPTAGRKWCYRLTCSIAVTKDLPGAEWDGTLAVTDLLTFERYGTNSNYKGCGVGRLSLTNH